MTFRFSKYNIYIDNENEVLVLNGMTGDFYKIPVELHKRYPDSKQVFRKSDIEVYLDSGTFDVLLRKGILTNTSEENEISNFARIIDNLHKRQLENELGYFIILTYNCSFRCLYCYQGDFNKNIKNKTFTKENIDIVLKTLPELEKDRKKGEKTKPRSFSLIGGEPLIKENHSIIEYFINQASKLGLSSFSAVSNGYDLDHYENLLGSGKINSIQMTLDGPPVIHDKLRMKKNGDKTFEKIAKNITMALGKGVNINLRVNVFRNNISKVHMLADIIAKNKWDENKHFSAYLGQLHGELPNIPKSQMMTAYEVLQFLEENKAVYPSLKIFVQPELKQIESISSFVQKGQSLFGNIKTAFCGAHINTIVIDPDRNLYTCMETDTSEDYFIGNIGADGSINMDNDNWKKWTGRKISSMPKCLECPYAVYCGGGCAVRAMENGDFNNGYCNEFQKIFKTYWKTL